MIKLRDVIEHLEEKVLRNVCGDEEYNLYSDYVWNGLKVFKMKKNKYIVRRLVDEIKAEGGYIDRQSGRQQEY